MALRWVNVGVLLFILHSLLWSQEDVKISKNHFKTGIEIGFKEAWNSIREGDKNYKAGVGTYGIARDHYLFSQQYNTNHAELNYKLGVCYLFTDDKYKAIDFFHKAYILDPEVSGDIHLLLGRAYQLVLEFDKAIEHYSNHMEVLDLSEQEAYSAVMTKYLAECQSGKNLSKKPVRVILQNPGEAINSKFDDYNPIFAYNDTALFFTSRRPFEKSKRNLIDNKFNEDIYISDYNGGSFDQAVRLEKPYNSENNDALVGISVEGDKILIYKGNIQGGDLRITTFNPEKNKWSRPKGFRSKIKSKDGETSACLSPDGQELYYISRNTELSLGGKDILRSTRDAKGKWKDPVNLGGEINTPYDEEGVFITPNGRFLYFASQGHNSMGGFDIFRSERKTNGEWSAPQNLGYPINTPDDEVFYITDQTGSYGYYSTIREGGIGSKDIYKVIYLGSEKELIFTTRDQLVAGPDTEKTGFLTLPRLLDLDSTFLLTGHVLDTIGDDLPVFSKLTFIDPLEGSQDAFAISDSATGKFTARLPQAKVYGVEINAPGYLYFLDILDLSGESNDQIIERNFYLQKVEVGIKVVLDNIYFQTGKSVLMPESFDELDQVLRFLENNPTIKLEIAGHTDNTGSLRINQKLSRERAKAVVDYLVAAGIDPEMLRSQGYADTQPVATNDTSGGRKQNRRVEFEVISK